MQKITLDHTVTTDKKTSYSLKFISYRYLGEKETFPRTERRGSHWDFFLPQKWLSFIKKGIFVYKKPRYTGIDITDLR